MADIASGAVKMIGLDKLTKKLYGETLVEPAKQHIYSESVSYGVTFLQPRIPRDTGKSAGLLESHVSAENGSISLPAFPLRFIEYGTQMHTGAGKRSHRKRTAAAWKGGQWRITPRRFWRNTSAAIRRNINKLIREAALDIEKRWSA